MASYDHELSLTAQITPGVTIEQIVDALSPILDYFGFDEENFVKGKFKVNFNDGELFLSTVGMVSTGFADLAEEVAQSLCKLTSEAGELSLIDHDAADPDNSVTKFVFGPTPESIEHFHFEDALLTTAYDMECFVGVERVGDIIDAINKRRIERGQSIFENDKWKASEQQGAPTV